MQTLEKYTPPCASSCLCVGQGDAHSKTTASTLLPSRSFASSSAGSALRRVKQPWELVLEESICSHAAARQEMWEEGRYCWLLTTVFSEINTEGITSRTSTDDFFPPPFSPPIFINSRGCDAKWRLHMGKYEFEWLSGEDQHLAMPSGCSSLLYYSQPTRLTLPVSATKKRCSAIRQGIGQAARTHSLKGALKGSECGLKSSSLQHVDETFGSLCCLLFVAP